MKNINENLSNFIIRRIQFDQLEDEIDNVIDYEVNPYLYSRSGDFVADVCNNLVDNIIEDFNIPPKEKDNLYYYFVDTFGKYITKKYQNTMKFRNNIDENIKKVLKEYLIESDPKIGTGKKPKGSDRRLYTDENPSDTVSVKFRTKQDIIDTLNKESFKSKSHQRQSQIINLIHQRLRVSLERVKDPEVKKRLKSAFDYIEIRKEKSKEETKKKEQTEAVNAAQQAAIAINMKKKGIRPKNEMKEQELTEKCWAGYTQKGMKTMFGKRYPNCVKKTKK